MPVDDGLRNVPNNTIFRVLLGEHQVVTATARWSREDRMGIEFSTALDLDERGAIAAVGLRIAGAEWEMRSRMTG